MMLLPCILLLMFCPEYQPHAGLDFTTSADVFAFTMNRHAILKALVSSTFIVSL